MPTNDNTNPRQENLELGYTDADFITVARRVPSVRDLLATPAAIAQTLPAIRKHWWRECAECREQVQVFERAVAPKRSAKPALAAALLDIVRCPHCNALQFHLPAVPIDKNERNLADHLAAIATTTARIGWDIQTRAWALVTATGDRYLIDYQQRLHVLSADGTEEHRDIDVGSDTEKALGWFGDVLHQQLTQNF